MTIWDTSQPPSPHSNELENRLTKLELKSDGHDKKLSLHEKAILTIASTVYVIAQDKFPHFAALIRGLLIP